MIRTICVLLVSWLALSPGHAQTILQFEFDGVVTDASGNTGVFGPFNSVQLDDTFTGRFSYEVGPGNPDQDPANQFGVYNLLSFEINQAVVPITPLGIAVVHDPGLPTIPPQPPDPGTDAIRLVGTYPTGVDDNTRPVTLRLAADYNTVFADDSLPLDLALTDFPVEHQVSAIVVLGVVGGESQIDAGEITSLLLVPEPSGSAYLLALSVTIAARRRYRRAKGATFS